MDGEVNGAKENVILRHRRIEERGLTIPSRPQHQHPQFPQIAPINESSTHLWPLLWDWVLEKEGTLEIAEQLANKEHETRDLPRFGPPAGNLTPTCILLINGEAEGYRGALMRSCGVYARVVDCSPQRALPAFI